MKRGGWLGLLLVGIGIALAVTLASPWASSEPDGLERVAEDEGFIDRAEDPSYEVIPDYQFPGVENERLATVLAGIVGVLIVAALAIGAGLVLQSIARRRREAATATGPPDPARRGG